MAKKHPNQNVPKSKHRPRSLKHSVAERLRHAQQSSLRQHDKSTWARRGLSVFNTVIEPDWRGFLTLELVYHGWKPLRIPAGAGIAQVIFHRTEETASYGNGKYQDQADQPVEAK